MDKNRFPQLFVPYTSDNRLFDRALASLASRQLGILISNLSLHPHTMTHASLLILNHSLPSAFCLPPLSYTQNYSKGRSFFSDSSEMWSTWTSSAIKFNYNSLNPICTTLDWRLGWVCLKCDVHYLLMKCCSAKNEWLPPLRPECSRAVV